MLNIVTTSKPDVRPARTIEGATYDHPAIVELKIMRGDININPRVDLRIRNFRLLTDEYGAPIMLNDGVTQKGEYGPGTRQYTFDLYEWIAGQSNAADIVGALNTLIGSVLAYDELMKP